MRTPRWTPADGLGVTARLEESRGTGSEQEVPAEAGAQDRALAPGALRGLEPELGSEASNFSSPRGGTGCRPLPGLTFWIPSIRITQGALPAGTAPGEAARGHVVSCPQVFSAVSR